MLLSTPDTKLARDRDKTSTIEHNSPCVTRKLHLMGLPSMNTISISTEASLELQSNAMASSRH